MRSYKEEADLVNSPIGPQGHPCKESADYVDFISLSGERETLCRKTATAWSAQPNADWCEVLYWTDEMRWILVFNAISTAAPALARPDESAEPPILLDVSGKAVPIRNKAMPISRELEWTDGMGWLQIHNFTIVGGAWQYRISAIPKPGELSRLDPQWRPNPSALPPASPPTPHFSPAAITQSDGGRSGKADLIVTKVPALGGNQATGNSKRQESKLRPPSNKAIMAYRLYCLKGQKQDEIAKELSRHFGCRISQGTVSRYISGTSEWITAGNVLPELPLMTKKPTPMDPRELERGRRLDGRVPRQRD